MDTTVLPTFQVSKSSSDRPNPNNYDGSGLLYFFKSAVTSHTCLMVSKPNHLPRIQSLLYTTIKLAIL